MIAYETFTKYFESGEITKLHFAFQTKEYLIAREEGESGTVFSFFAEGQEPVKYPTAKALFKYAFISGHSLREIWYYMTPICNDTLFDEDYVTLRYADTFGRITHSASGTLTHFDRYPMRHLLPSLVLASLLILALVLFTLFIPELSWVFFAVASSIVVGATVIAQLIFLSNTKKYRHGNPRAHFYLLNHGIVILTTRTEYPVPYLKILRLDTEAGIKIATLYKMFTFVANDGAEMTETLKGIVEELKTLKHHHRKKKNQRSSAS